MKPLQFTAARAVIIAALKVSVVVGTCLNTINQGSQLWLGEEIEWGKVALNYLVPYLVASYSAARALMDHPVTGQPD